jgi:hypothetical protein
MEHTITHLNVSLTTSYGNYVITGIVNGELVKANTKNSMAYDWYNDDEDLEKMEEAIEYCHRRLFDAYEYQETN